MAISVYNKIIPVSNENAFATGKLISRSEGVLAGISSGTVACVAFELAKRPNTGDRHLSTLLFTDEA